MSDADTQTNPYKPLTHAQRGCLGGLAKVPKGFASSAVMAKALETRARNRAIAKAITDDFDLTHQQPTKEHDHGPDQ